jgi:uncharacterized repeat protein (TIGR02543 family)
MKNLIRTKHNLILVTFIVLFMAVIVGAFALSAGNTTITAQATETTVPIVLTFDNNLRTYAEDRFGVSFWFNGTGGIHQIFFVDVYTNNSVTPTRFEPNVIFSATRGFHTCLVMHDAIWVNWQSLILDFDIPISLFNNIEAHGISFVRMGIRQNTTTLTHFNLTPEFFSSGNHNNITPANFIYHFPTRVDLPPNPSKEGHTFKGWYFDTAFTQPYNGQPIFNDTTLHARFDVNQHSVTFVTGVTGLTVNPQTLNWDTKANVPTEPTRQGFKFAGWYTDTGRTIAYDFNNNVREDVTLFAAWERIVLTVTFLVGGNIHATVDVYWGATLLEAATAAQVDADVLTAFYSDSQMFNPLSVNTVLTSNALIHAEIGTGIASNEPQKSWFANNWVWLTVGASVTVALGVALSIFLVKKRS